MSGEGPRPDDVAVVGMACRVPGADSVDDLWALMARGDAATGPVPTSRTTLAGLDADARGASWGGFLADIHGFDAGHFGVSPAEAPHLDVQQRLVLETAWHALEDAGIPVADLAGTRTGVFVGQGTHDHAMLFERGGVDPSPFVNTGLSHALAANRLSYHWDLRGPSMAVDTACSSSLVALHLAVRSLRSRDCDLAVVAGVNALLSPWPQLGAAALTALSPTGRCRPFDADADGYVRSEGVGVVVLRRLRDVGDDRVRAVVLGSATNQDGRTNGITAPSGRAQSEVVRAALADAGTTPAQLSYVEAHGTGTPLGDPIEARALAAALAGRDEPLPIGSVKGHVGHTEAAAGVVGFIRTVLVLERREVPRQAGHVTPSPAVGLDRLRLSVATRPLLLPGEAPVAGVSSFGFGGSNAHVVLAGPAWYDRPTRPESAPAGRPLLLVSGSGPEAVRTLLQEYARTLAEVNGRAAAELVAAVATRRSHLPHRIAVPADGFDDLAATTSAAARRAPGRIQVGRRRLGFVFSGHGSQWVGMGRRLLGDETAFADTVAECDAAFAPLLRDSVAERLASHCEEDLADVTIVQPLLFTIQVGLARALAAAGVSPDAVVGHSIGEVAAAVVAGTLSLPDGCRVVHHRNQAVSGVRGAGGMAVVELTHEEAETLLSGLGVAVDVAAVNSPRSCVISGDDAGLDRVLSAVAESGADFRRVRVDYPSHSRLVEAAATRLSRHLAGLQCHAPALAVYSTVDGDRAVGPADAGYWGRNLRSRVRFMDAIRAMHRDGVTHFLEIAPHPVLTTSVGETLEGGATTLQTLSREPGRDGLTPVLAAIYEAGIEADHGRMVGGRGSAATRLPRYPFDHTVQHVLHHGGARQPAEPSGDVPIPAHLLTGHRPGRSEILSATSLAVLVLAHGTGQPADSAVGAVEGIDFLAPVQAGVRLRHDAAGRTLHDDTGRTLLGYRAAHPATGGPDAAPAGEEQPGTATDVDVDASVEAARLAGVELSSVGTLITRLRRSGPDAWARVADPADPLSGGARALEAALLAALVTGWHAAETAGGSESGVRPVVSVGRFELARPLGDVAGELSVRILRARAGDVGEVVVRDSAGSLVARISDVRLASSECAAPAELVDGAVLHTPATVASVVQESLAQVIPGVEDVRAVGRVPFAELGLDSLLAAELRNRLERRLGLRLSMAMFWRHPCVEQLTDALTQMLPGSAPEPATADGGREGAAARPANPLDDLLAVLDAE